MTSCLLVFPTVLFLLFPNENKSVVTFFHFEQLWRPFFFFFFNLGFPPGEMARL